MTMRMYPQKCHGLAPCVLTFFATTTREVAENVRIHGPTRQPVAYQGLARPAIVARTVKNHGASPWHDSRQVAGRATPMTHDP